MAIHEAFEKQTGTTPEVFSKRLEQKAKALAIFKDIFENFEGTSREEHYGRYAGNSSPFHNDKRGRYFEYGNYEIKSTPLATLDSGLRIRASERIAQMYAGTKGKFLSKTPVYTPELSGYSLDFEKPNGISEYAGIMVASDDNPLDPINFIQYPMSQGNETEADRLELDTELIDLALAVHNTVK